MHYLHSCARISASWLKESHVQSETLSSLRTLCTAVAYITCETDNILPGPYTIDDDVLWCISSIDNYLWLLAYYTTASEMGQKYFGHKPNSWMIDKKLEGFAAVFPENPFSAPADVNDVRVAYAESGRLCQYRKYKPPYWLRKTISIQEPEQKESRTYGPLDDLM